MAYGYWLIGLCLLGFCWNLSFCKSNKSIIVSLIMRNFRNYDVWTAGVDFSAHVYELTEKFPKKELYALCDQLQRASVSIPSNIAEGCSRRSQNEFAHYLEISLGSSYEVETQMEIALKLKYVTMEQYNSIIEEVQSIEKRLTSLINTVRPE